MHLTIGPNVSPGPQANPERTQAPIKDSYEVAVARQTADAIPMVIDIHSAGRRPNKRATGTQTRLEKPRTRMQMPV